MRENLPQWFGRGNNAIGYENEHWKKMRCMKTIENGMRAVSVCVCVWGGDKLS